MGCAAQGRNAGAVVAPPFRLHGPKDGPLGQSPLPGWPSASCLLCSKGEVIVISGPGCATYLALVMVILRLTVLVNKEALI